MKKLLAICLTFIMVISVLAVPAFAATVEVPAKTLVDQSFAGLTAIPDGWEVAGTSKAPANEDGTSAWPNGIVPSAKGSMKVRSAEKIDAGKAGYTVKVTAAHYQRMSIHIGAETAENAVADAYYGGNTGYTIYSVMAANGDYSKTGIKIFEGTTEIANNNAVGSYDWFKNNSEWIITVTDNKITVNAGGATIEADLTQPAVKNGYIGICNVQNTGTNNCIVKSIKADTIPYQYKVEASQKTTGAYAAWDEVVEGQEYVNVPSYSVAESVTSKQTFNTEAIEIPADMDAKLTVSLNDTAYRDATTTLGFLGYTLKFVRLGEVVTISLLEGTRELDSAEVHPSTIGSKYSYNGYDYYAGAVNITIEMTNSNITATVAKAANVTATLTSDIESRINTGDVYVIWGSSYSSNKRLNNLVFETLDKTLTTKKTDFLLDKTFTANDTEASVEADGFVVTDGTTFSVDGAANTGNAVSIEYNALDFGGKYTVEAVMRKDAGTQTILVNKDGDSYYGLSFGNNNCQATKYVDGKAAYTWDNNVSATAYLFTYGFSTFTVNVSEEANGSVKISYTAKGPGGTLTGEFEDVLSDENAVLTSGDVCVKAIYGAASTRYIKSLKVYPTSVADPVYEGNFDIGGTAVSAAAKGVTYFTFPVTMLGQSPDFIAALYEDGKMTDIKFFDAATANEGAVELFDTTNSKANKVEIKVFVWDTLEGMIPVLAPFTLK